MPQAARAKNRAHEPLRSDRQSRANDPDHCESGGYELPAVPRSGAPPTSVEADVVQRPTNEGKQERDPASADEPNNRKRDQKHERMQLSTDCEDELAAGVAGLDLGECDGRLV
jgi:hypothetical protein